MTTKEFVLFLREVADFLERYPDVPIPDGANEITLHYTVNEYADQNLAKMFEDGFSMRELEEVVLYRRKEFLHGVLEIGFPNLQKFPDARPAQ